MGTDIVQVDHDIQGGTPVFVGTRVPIKSLFDYLEAGESLEVFLGDFPAVSREVAVAALEQARLALGADASGAFVTRAAFTPARRPGTSLPETAHSVPGPRRHRGTVRRRSP